MNASAKVILGRYLRTQRRHLMATSLLAQQTQRQRGSLTPRRAIMYVPGYDDRKAKKASTLIIDSIVLDCEDGVAINRKREARENIPTLLNNIHFGSSNRIVRVNSRESGLAKEDVLYILNGAKLPDGILLPKVNSADDLKWFIDLVSNTKVASQVSKPMAFAVMIETAMSIINLKEIASFDCHPLELQCLIFGADDFLAEIGATKTDNAAELLYARQSIVVHAKAYGLQAIDMVHNNYKDLDALQRQAIEGSLMGFNGKQVIHPGQIEIVQESFMPSSEKVEWARELSTAFEEHQSHGKGAFIFRGQMIDRPLLLQANNILEIINAVKPQATTP